ncbi:MAG: fumarate hydratase, partial [Gammaproteobacteria bacterium]|nr:fumarate hydratase [Gammaproteobacteria bacterium]
MSNFEYHPPYPLGKDKTEYRLLTDKHVSTDRFQDEEMLVVEPEALKLLAAEAIRDVSHLFRTSHLQQLRNILDDDEASANDKFVALELLKNATISADMILPSCQDTGTAIVSAKKGQQVWSGNEDCASLSAGIAESYATLNLRNSQMSPLTVYEEKNSGTNLPAQIDIEATGGDEYKFLFMTKGGGSANKTFLFQETKAVLNPQSMHQFLLEKLPMLGTAACPPYHLAIVIGGTSAESNLKNVKLASARYLDELPTEGNDYGQAFRDLELEKEVLQLTREELGLGAQFGGKYFAHDVRVIRLPRHGASCPIGIGVSCSADRNILGKINRDGVWLENLDRDPARFLPAPSEQK